MKTSKRYIRINENLFPEACTIVSEMYYPEFNKMHDLLVQQLEPGAGTFDQVTFLSRVWAMGYLQGIRIGRAQKKGASSAEAEAMFSGPEYE